MLAKNWLLSVSTINSMYARSNRELWFRERVEDVSNVILAYNVTNAQKFAVTVVARIVLEPALGRSTARTVTRLSTYKGDIEELLNKYFVSSLFLIHMQNYDYI